VCFVCPSVLSFQPYYYIHRKKSTKMDFASPVAYIGNDEDEELAVEEDELQSSSLVSNLAADKKKKATNPAAPKAAPPPGFFGRIFSSRAVAAPPVQPAPEPEPASESKAHVRSRRVAHQTDTNAVVVKFATLSNNADELFAGDPVECKHCQAILSFSSKIQTRSALRKTSASAPVQQGDVVMHVIPEDNEPSSQVDAESKEDPSVWVCEFCGEENAVDLLPEEIPKTESRDYVLDPGAAVDAEEKGVAKDNGSVIFVIDISGSMCITTEVPGKMVLKGAKRPAGFDLPAEPGFVNAAVGNSNSTWVSRLQCMQAAVDQQLETWRKEQPNRRVGIVTFNREVTVFGDGFSQPEVITGDKLSKHDELMQIGQRLSVEKPVSESGQTLSAKLFGLEEGGPTALGPALLVAVAMASKVNGSRVVVCTDGLANVGIGALDKQSCPDDNTKLAAENWYQGVGDMAKLAGVGVSIISIKGEECDLEALGKVAEMTGGDVLRVDPLELHKNFSSMLAKPVIATQVSATFLIHSGLTFRNEDNDINKIVREIGNVTEDTEVAFEFGVRSDDALKKYGDLKALPFQVQIRFTKFNGMKCLRVLSKMQPVTRNRHEAERNVRLDVLAANAAQQSAQLAEKGRFREARLHNLAHGKLMRRSAARDSASSNVYNAWVSEADDYHGALSRQEMQLDMLESAAPPVGASRDAAGLLAPPSAAPASSFSSISRARLGRNLRSDADFEQQHRFKGKSSASYSTPAPPKK